MSIDKRRHVQLLLHIAVECIRHTGDAVDFRGDGIECAAGRILAFDNGKGLKNCTHVDSFQTLVAATISGAVSFRRSAAEDSRLSSSKSRSCNFTRTAAAIIRSARSSSPMRRSRTVTAWSVTRALLDA
jgi:hypothetical protein